jgi:prephenate dehydrogenase
VVVISDGDRVEPLMRVLGVGGGRLVQLELADHDRICAALQVLTHATVLAFGLALTRLDVDAAEINALAPPPHATLLAVLARILSGKPAVYWEIQAESEHGERAREALGQALNELAALVGDGDAGGFGRRLEELSAWFGEDLEPRREMCARMFGLTAGQKPGPKEMG